MGLPCETVIASIREPSDFAGLPIVVGDGVRFAPPAWARRLAEAGHGLLFLDELSTAPPAVQAALLRVVLERAVGDLTLPDEVAVVAAANPPEQAADGWDLSAPLANRLCHLAWQTDPRAVADGLAGGWAAPVVPGAARRVAGRGDLVPRPGRRLLARPARAGLRAAVRRGVRGPRLAVAADLGDGGPADGRRGRRRHRRRGRGPALVRGAVGDGAGRRVPGLAGRDGPARSGGGAGRPGLASGCPSGATAPTPRWPRSRPRSPRTRPPERWTAGWQVLGLAADAAPDVAAVAARVLARCRPEGAALPAEIRLFAPCCATRACCSVSSAWLSAGIEGLAAARLWAATRFPYLATGMFGAQVIAEPGSGTVSVDESWRMRADPELTAHWTPAQLGSVLVHHVCHLLRTHGERAQATGVAAGRGAAWVRAADAEINDDLVPAGLDLPGRPVLPRDLGAADGLLAEQYFAGIRRRHRGGQGRGDDHGPSGVGMG